MLKEAFIGNRDGAAGVAEKPLINLTPEQIFVSPNSMLLTRLGSTIQQLTIKKDESLAPPRKDGIEVTGSRLTELREEIDEICKTNDIPYSQIERLGTQFHALVAERNAQMVNPRLLAEAKV